MGSYATTSGRRFFGSVRSFHYNAGDLLSASPSTTTTTTINISEDRINAVTTLPVSLLSRQQVFQNVIKEAQLKNPTKQYGENSLFIKKWFTFGKAIIAFYKHGIVNVWKNQTSKKHILKEKYYVDLINFTANHKKSTAVQSSSEPSQQFIRGKIGSGKELTKYLLNEIYLGTVTDTKKAQQQQHMKKREKVEQKPTQSTSLLKISRAEYQLILRTERDFPKLPIFGLLFLLFEEMTPLVCFLVPSLIPSTCILPNLLKKQELLQIGALTKIVPIADANSSTVTMVNEKKQTGAELISEYFKIPGKLHQLTMAELRYLHKFFKLPLLTRFSRLAMVKALEQHRNEVIVDNYLVLNDGGFEKMNIAELVRSGNQRGLISAIELVSEESSSGEHGNFGVVNVDKFQKGNGYDEGINTTALVEKLTQFAKEIKFEV